MKEIILKLVITTFLIFILLGGCIQENSTAEPKLIFVDDDGEADFALIQNAIDYASIGDTIFIRNGTFNERLIIDKSINLIGESKDNTIIQHKEGNTPSENITVLINSDNCSINGFKIIGPGSALDIIGVNINASNSTVSNNILLNYNKGVQIGKFAEDTKNNNVSSNIISNCAYGIISKYSKNNYISKNNISLSIFDGIQVYSSDYNVVFGNTASNNKFFGIRIKGSDYNTVFGNLLIMNQGGVYCCCGSGYNTIYHNNFKQNYERNGRDDINNQWDNGSVGNYWDDYNGSDADNDNIGDTPYYITSLIKDEFPIIKPIDIYDIDN